MCKFRNFYYNSNYLFFIMFKILINMKNTNHANRVVSLQ